MGRRLLLVTLVGFCATACERGAEETEAAPALGEMAQRQARASFLQHCSLCHGERGDGHGVRQSGLVGRPVDFTDPGWRRGATFEGVMDTIRNGVTGTSMPAFRALGDEDVRRLAAYVLSIGEQGP